MFFFVDHCWGTINDSDRVVLKETRGLPVLNLPITHQVSV